MIINKTNYVMRLIEQKKLNELKKYFEENIKDSKVCCDGKGVKTIHVLIADKEGRFVAEYHFLNYNYVKTVIKRTKSHTVQVDDKEIHKLFIEFMKKTFPTYEQDYLEIINENLNNNISEINMPEP